MTLNDAGPSRYPPASPPRPVRPVKPPSLHVNTYPVSHAPSTRSAGQSPARSAFASQPLYQIPVALDSSVPMPSRARPGGLAGIIGSDDRYQSPAARQSRLRRDSEDRSVRPMSSRRGSENSLPPLSHRHNPSPTKASIFAGREGSIHTTREMNAAVKQADLRLFAHHCRLFYFSPAPPESSAAYISSTLASLPPSHRAAYTRLQSTLRSLAHLHHLRVRISSFHALIASTIASASLTPLARPDLAGKKAASERYQKMSSFITTWCTSGAGGVQPFFRGLWAILRAQSRGEEKRGGGGSRCVVWEIDDAVFLESGGTDFMQEAVIMLKGVLGFHDKPLTLPPKLRRIRTIPRSYSDVRDSRPPPYEISSPKTSRYTLEELRDNTRELANGSEAASRSRATSDPFIDARAGRNHSPLPPPSRGSVSHPLHHRQAEYPVEGISGADSPLLSEQAPVVVEEAQRLLDDDDDPTEDDIAVEEAELSKPRFRLWVFPVHISDEEAERMLRLFPRFISRGKDARFPFIRPGRGIKELESGYWQSIEIQGVLLRIPHVEVEDQEGVMRSGTGRMWVGLDERWEGWAGSRWYRFKRWWRRLFGMG